jgi:adenylosuccinate synthase
MNKTQALNASIVVGLGFGDEGKGAWVNHLVKQNNVKYVVRFNGGAQALHHVVRDDGVLHAYSQFGSGTFYGAKTILSQFMLVEPLALVEEARSLSEKGIEDPLSLMTISETAPVITPLNRLLNRIQETYRSKGRHGSCGFGIGITQGDAETLGQLAIRMQDLQLSTLREKLEAQKLQRIQTAKQFENDHTWSLIQTLESYDLGKLVEAYQEISQHLAIVSDGQIHQLIRNNSSVFEGAQGVLLDQQFGFFPNVTRSNCTFQNALQLLEDAMFEGSVTKIGVARGYMTRHGAGPFVTEDESIGVTHCHNVHNQWQGTFRHGWPDAVALRYALKSVQGVDQLAFTNMDRLVGIPKMQIANRYESTSCYFTDGQIDSVPNDLAELAKRTAALSEVVPKYISVPNWNFGCERSINTYIEMMQDQIGRKIDEVKVVA